MDEGKRTVVVGSERSEDRRVPERAGHGVDHVLEVPHGSGRRREGPQLREVGRVGEGRGHVVLVVGHVGRD